MNTVQKKILAADKSLAGFHHVKPEKLSILGRILKMQNKAANKLDFHSLRYK